MKGAHSVLSRRKFLQRGLTALLTSGFALKAGAKLLTAAGGRRKETRWAFLIDATKCVGCGMCVKACKVENDIPLDIPASRTWVEHYVQKKDGTVFADSPKAARDGFTQREVDAGEGKSLDIPEGEVAKTLFIPKLCNQCDKPACVQVCPVGATYQADDGVVLVDRSWCIGCGYCIMACPYGVRFFNPVTKSAEKCNWCYQRLSKGLKPACVDACPFGVRRIGNLMDPEDPVTKIIRTERVSVLKEEYGTGPQTYYLGLDVIVR